MDLIALSTAQQGLADKSVTEVVDARPRMTSAGNPTKTTTGTSRYGMGARWESDVRRRYGERCGEARSARFVWGTAAPDANKNYVVPASVTVAD
jgi:hypothetical protein